MTVLENVHQSRFGFHPCSKETSKKLRFLNGVYSKHLHQVGAWGRWYRKDPQNRILRRAIRDSKNQKIGWEVIGPWLEPQVCPIFHQNSIGYIVLEASRQARMPQPTPEDVKPLILTDEEIDRLYEAARAWV